MARRFTVAERLRSYREGANMTIAELSGKSGVPETIIIAAELGDVIPVTAILFRLATALGVRLGTFLDDQYKEDPVITRAGERIGGTPTGYDGANPVGFTYHSLACGKPDRHMDPFFIELSANASEKIPGHEGECLIICESGRIELEYGGEEHVLSKGDSAYFNTTVPYAVRAADSKPATFWGVSFMPL